MRPLIVVRVGTNARGVRSECSRPLLRPRPRPRPVVALGVYDVAWVRGVLSGILALVMLSECGTMGVGCIAWLANCGISVIGDARRGSERACDMMVGGGER